MDSQNVCNTLNALAKEVHERAIVAGWYKEGVFRNVGEILALIHSEISEALEGYRRNLQDDHLPHRPMIEVELADAIIRIGDLAAYLGLDLGGALVEKMEYNLHRQDHKLETRSKEDGKRF